MAHRPMMPEDVRRRLTLERAGASTEPNPIYDYVFGGMDLGRVPPVWSFVDGKLRIAKGPLVITMPCRLEGPLDRYLAQLGDA